MVPQKKAWVPPADIKKLMEKPSITTSELLDAVTDCYFHILGGNELALDIIMQQVTKLGINTDNPSKDNLLRLIGELDKVAAAFMDRKDLNRSKNRLTNYVSLCKAY